MTLHLEVSSGKDVCETVMRCAVGVTGEFKMVVGLHQGFTLSPFSMMFADDTDL